MRKAAAPQAAGAVDLVGHGANAPPPRQWATEPTLRWEAPPCLALLEWGRPDLQLQQGASEQHSSPPSSRPDGEPTPGKELQPAPARTQCHVPALRPTPPSSPRATPPARSRVLAPASRQRTRRTLCRGHLALTLAALRASDDSARPARGQVEHSLIPAMLPRRAVPDGQDVGGEGRQQHPEINNPPTPNPTHLACRKHAGSTPLITAPAGFVPASTDRVDSTREMSCNWF